jgi:hypothetical protein
MARLGRASIDPRDATPGGGEWPGLARPVANRREISPLPVLADDEAWSAHTAGR